MQKKERKKSNIINFIVYIILTIIIVLLCLKTCTLMNKKEEEPKIPTGNVDIFEIQCDKKACIIETDNKEENIPVSNKVNGAQHEVEINEGNVIVEDKDIIWKSINNLRIFSNSMYNYNNIIAPEDSNEYEFKVNNNTIYNVKYSIKFLETNDYSINLKYKLKRGDKYIAGDEENWVDYSKLNINNKNLKISDSDTYYLEWKWVSSDNDALVGNISANYQLKIQIDAESIN